MFLVFRNCPVLGNIGKHFEPSINFDIAMHEKKGFNVLCSSRHSKCNPIVKFKGVLVY